MPEPRGLAERSGVVGAEPEMRDVNLTESDESDCFRLLGRSSTANDKEDYQHE
jgi:hypothetical protein